MKFFAWADDALNPIVVKELRQAVHSRLVVTGLMLFVGILVFLFGVMLLFNAAHNESGGLDGRLGRNLFMVVHGIVLFTCMVLIPAYTGVRLASERGDQPDLYFISALSPRAILLGKFASALILALQVFCVCGPFMMFSYLLRGIDIPSIALLSGVTLVATLVGTQAALFIASIPAPRPVRFVLHFVAIIQLAWLFGGVISASSELIDGGIPDEPGFWATLGGLTLLSLSQVGMLFFWSVALISPNSANRAWPGRAFVVGQWLILGAAAVAIDHYVPSTRLELPVMLWCIYSTMVACALLLIACNERREWGPRAARTIPSNLFLRLIAFLFSSGAAGGVILSVLLLAGTLGFGFLWDRWYVSGAGSTLPGPAGPISHDTFARGLEVLLILSLYAFAYTMTAVLVGRYLFGSAIRRQYTWLVATLLLGLGCAVPAVLAFLFYQDELGRQQGLAWWMMPNPFVAMFEIGRSSIYDYNIEDRVNCLAFVLIWSAVVGLGSIPWLVEQIARFQPPRRVIERAGREPLAEVALVEAN